MRSERAEMAFSALGWGSQALHSDRGSCRKSLYLHVGREAPSVVPARGGHGGDQTPPGNSPPAQPPASNVPRSLPLLGSLTPSPYHPMLIAQASLPPGLPLGSHPIRIETPPCPFIAFLGTQRVLVTHPHQCEVFDGFLHLHGTQRPHPRGQWGTCFVPVSPVPNTVPSTGWSLSSRSASPPVT